MSTQKFLEDVIGRTKALDDLKISILKNAETHLSGIEMELVDVGDIDISSLQQHIRDLLTDKTFYFISFVDSNHCTVKYLNKTYGWHHMDIEFKQVRFKE